MGLPPFWTVQGSPRLPGAASTASGPVPKGSRAVSALRAQPANPWRVEGGPGSRASAAEQWGCDPRVLSPRAGLCPHTVRPPGTVPEPQQLRGDETPTGVHAPGREPPPPFVVHHRKSPPYAHAHTHSHTCKATSSREPSWVGPLDPTTPGVTWRTPLASGPQDFLELCRERSQGLPGGSGQPWERPPGSHRCPQS